jgi:hypothetical protein
MAWALGGKPITVDVVQQVRPRCSGLWLLVREEEESVARIHPGRLYTNVPTGPDSAFGGCSA